MCKTSPARTPLPRAVDAICSPRNANRWFHNWMNWGEPSCCLQKKIDRSTSASKSSRSISLPRWFCRESAGKRKSSPDVLPRMQHLCQCPAPQRSKTSPCQAASARMPLTFFWLTSTSFGHLIRGLAVQVFQSLRDSQRAKRRVQRQVVGWLRFENVIRRANP